MRRDSGRPAELSRETATATHRLPTPSPTRSAPVAAGLPGAIGWLCVALFIAGASIFGAAIEAGSRLESDAATPASHVTEDSEPIAASASPADCFFD